VAIAGASRGERPVHPRGRYLGFVHEVTDLLHAVDFIINVNRFSLFDLSTIEAAETGRPMLLHATGGNITFQRLGAGTVMLENLNTTTIARGLEECFTMRADQRVDLGRASRRCYEEHLTLQHLWRGHAALYDGAAVGEMAPIRA
jgi:hypothetical protein